MRRNPAGEDVVVAPELGEETADDPQRVALCAAALAALERPHEIWRLVGEEPDDPVEHQPHVLWCRPGGAEPEVVVAGTRRLDGRLHLHTWFRLGDPEAALRRYWGSGTATYPVRSLASTYAARRDVLYLRAEPAIPYRVLRLGGRLSIFAYADARLGFPSLVGLEVQDARRHAATLLKLPELRGLLASPCSVDGGPPAPLGDAIAALLAADSKGTTAAGYDPRGDS